MCHYVQHTFPALVAKVCSLGGRTSAVQYIPEGGRVGAPGVRFSTDLHFVNTPFEEVVNVLLYDLACSWVYNRWDGIPTHGSVDP